MAEVTIRVCDLCQGSDPQTATDAFSITNGGRTRELDVCPEHASGLADAMAAGHVPKPRARPRRSGRGGSIEVTPMEQIEAMRK